jgi:hypothetical protein
MNAAAYIQKHKDMMQQAVNSGRKKEGCALKTP